MPMPLEVLVKLRDGREEFYYIPITLMRGEKKRPTYAEKWIQVKDWSWACLLYTSPSPRDKRQSRMPSSA